MTTPSQARRPAFFYAGLFLVTAATLMLQIVQTRILSVVAWYHLAFFVISIAMFGLTAGAVWVYLRRERFTGRTLACDLGYFSGWFALSTAVALVVQLSLSLLPSLSPTAIAAWALTAICIAVPFFFSGIVVSLALTRSPFPIGRVYGVDLAGAAIGCLGVLLLLDHTDAVTAVLWIAALVAGGAMLFAASGVGTAPERPSLLAGIVGRPGWLLAIIAVGALGNGLSDQPLQPVSVKGKLEAAMEPPLHREWNSFSRIAVFRKDGREPHMWGPAAGFSPAAWPIEQLDMNIDGDAGTTMFGIQGDIGRAGFLKEDVTNLAHYLPGHERAAVIGVGGGRDMLSARAFGVPDITGVEINPIFVRLLTKEPGFAEFAGLNAMPGIRFETDEARSWFARTDERFDIVQMSLIDTWAATGAGAFTLTENGLYTVAAWKTFLDRLEPDGVFTVSRWFAPSLVDETGRMISLAMATLFERRAADPRSHIVLAARGSIATLILSKAPLGVERVALLERVASEKGHGILISPSAPPGSDLLRNIVASDSRAALDRYTATLERDLTPPTDERPFFFNQLPLHSPAKALRFAFGEREEGVSTGNLLATATLLMLLAVSAALVAGTIVLPLRHAVRDVGRRLAVGGTAYFLLIGAGFMMTEIALLQRMSILLGHPIYSLSVVLFSIILATGIGSFVSERFPLVNPGRFAAWALATAAYLAALPFWLPSLVAGFAGATLAVRAALCVLAIAPAGLLMGYGFPTGMRLVAAVDNRPTPWFWGINGAAGVLASGLAVVISIAFGISTSLTIAAIAYLLLIPAAAAIGFAAHGGAAVAHAPAAT